MTDSENIFHIILQRPESTYSPGEVVEGSLILSNSKVRTNIQYISLEMKATASVNWAELEPSHSGQFSGMYQRNKSKSKLVKYSNEESYCYEKILLFGNETECSTLQPCRMTFPFRFQLPQNIPSSFESSKGNVTYKLRARMTRKNTTETPDMTLSTLFYVSCPLDLNLEYYANIGEHVEKTRTIIYCFRKNCVIRVRLELQRYGYVPGENILLRGEVLHDESVAISRVSVSLLQNIKYYAVGKTWVQPKKICTWVLEGVRGLETPGNIQIPPSIPPSRLDHCGIIDVSYALHIKADLDKKINKKLWFNFPLLIGTVPIRCQEIVPSPIPCDIGSLCAIDTERELPVYDEVMTLMSEDDSPPPKYAEVVEQNNVYFDK